MAERLTPGVYVEEVSGGVRPIQGVSTSTVGFIGEAPRGIPDRATFINGFQAYQRAFGGHRRGAAGFLAQAVDAFFRSGGRRGFVVRVLPQNALQAGSEPVLARDADAWGLQREVLQFNARGAGAWAAAIRVHVEPSTSFQDAAFAVRVESVEGGRTQTLERFDNLRMDPEHEDYIGTVLNDTSRYVTVTDLLRAAIDAEAPALPPLPERAAALATRPAGTYAVPEGARIEFRWRDAAAPGGNGGDHLAAATFDNAAVTGAGAAFADGIAQLTPQQLGQILTNALGTADYRVSVPAAPARLVSNDAPFDTTGGVNAVVQIDGAPRNLAFAAAAPAVIDLGPGPFGGLAAGQRIVLTVDGGAPQEYDLTAGDIAGGGTAAELAAVFSREFTGVQAFVEGGGNLIVRTDRRGTGASLAIAGTAAAALGGPAPQTGSGNVANPAAVTAQELAAIFNAALGPGAPFEARVQDAQVVFIQIDTTATHTIQWISDPGPATIVANTALQTGPAVPAAGAQVVIQPAVATRAYLIIRLPAGASSFAAGGTARTIQIDVGDGANTATFTTAIPAGETRTPTALAADIEAAIAATPANAFALTAEAAGEYVVLTAGPAAAGVGISISVNGAPIWTGEQSLPGEAGALVESQASVEISASEPFRPGVARVLGTLIAAPRASGIDQNTALDGRLRPRLTEDAPIRLRGGTDGSGEVGLTEYAGTVTADGQRTGLRAFDTADINILVMPGRNDPGFVAMASAYCDANDIFLILDGVGSTERDFSVGTDAVRQFVEGLPARSNNAAMYYPWVEVPDPVGVGRNPMRFVPPSGHMAGIFARTDNTRGVWKAPAGIEATVSGAVALQHDLLDADQDLLNPIGLNCIRQFSGTGIIAWGSRTLAADPEWRYVPVRRTALFLKQSVRRGLQWAVFEPNDETLWEQIRTNITAFMMGLFRQGAFQGATPDEAFAVQCDRETNPQELVDQGIVTARLAFAPLKPAEFVVIEISQKTLLTA